MNWRQLQGKTNMKSYVANQFALMAVQLSDLEDYFVCLEPC